MLIEFSVANFRSIRERVTLSMMATDEEGLDHNVIQPQGLLKSAVIYGANASGKSNVLKAMEFMVEFVRESHRVQKGDLIPVSPFRLDVAFEGQPSEFEVLFIYDGMKYAYGFKVDREKVHEEYLYEYPKGVQTLIFERAGSTDFEFGMDEQEQGVLAKRTLSNMLYLAIATQFNYGKVATAFEWFKNQVECWIGEFENFNLPSTEGLFVSNDAIRTTIVEFFNNIDTGIKNIMITINQHPTGIVSDPFWGAGRNNTNRQAGEVNPYQAEKYQVELMHKTVDVQGKSRHIAFELKDESLGTQRLFQLIGPWIEVLQSGRILIVDELENSLHPLIVEQLITLLHHSKHNDKGAQLIFTTHNTNLLDNTLFRRDQIWFTEKDQSQGSTDLYSLAEFTPRESEDIEKGYLLGRYGAIPFFGKEFLF